MPGTQTRFIYAPGTTVVYNKNTQRGFSSYVGQKTVICQVSLDTGEITYGTLQGAWLAHDSLDWVADPTPKSLAAVFAFLAEEEKEDEGC